MTNDCEYCGVPQEKAEVMLMGFFVNDRHPHVICGECVNDYKSETIESYNVLKIRNGFEFGGLVCGRGSSYRLEDGRAILTIK